MINYANHLGVKGLKMKPKYRLCPILQNTTVEYTSKGEKYEFDYGEPNLIKRVFRASQDVIMKGGS
jgi:hypothetical protein